jgi:hypothetical protein
MEIMVSNKFYEYLEDLTPRLPPTKAQWKLYYDLCKELHIKPGKPKFRDTMSKRLTELLEQVDRDNCDALEGFPDDLFT